MAILKKKQGGTKVGNFIRNTVSNIKTGAQVVASSPITKTIAKSASVGLPGGSMAASVYNSVAPVVKTSSTSTKAKPVSSYAPLPAGAKNMSYASDAPKNMSYANQPQYSPAGGVGSSSNNGFTFTESGWIPTSKAGPKQKTGGIPLANTGASNMAGASYSPSGSSNARTSALGSGSYGSTGSSYSGYTGSGLGITSKGAGDLNAPSGAAMIGGEDFDYEKTPQQIAEEEALRRAQEYADQQSRLNVNPENTYQDALRQFQGEIDAVNQVYAERLRQAGLEGKSRLGSTRAQNFNAGIVDSSFGAAATERAMSENRGIEAGIMGEKLQALSQIESTARQLGDKYYQDKKAAKEAGLDNYLAVIRESGKMKDAISSEIATSILNSGITVDEISPAKLAKIAKDAGVSVQKIKNDYKKIVEEMALAEQEAAQKGQFNLGKDQVRYDQYGNVIAGNMGGGYEETGGFSQEVLALAEQVNSGALSPQQVPSALRGQVAMAQKSLPNPRVTELDSVIATIDELASNPKLKNILGPVDQAIGGVFGEAATARNLYNQLTGILALEGRSKLKGSGAISDFEFRVLKDAQSALGRNLNEVEFKKQLQKVRDVLENRKQVLSGGSGGQDLGGDVGGGSFSEEW
jgi:hypothetical protein